MRRDIELYPAHSRKCRSDSEERRNPAGKHRNFFRFVPPHFRPCGADSRAKQREQSANSSTVPFPALSSDARQGKQPCQSVSRPILCHNSAFRPVFKAGHAPSGSARQGKQPFDTISHFLPTRKAAWEAALSRFPSRFVLQFRLSSRFQSCFPLHLVAQGRASRLAKPFRAPSCAAFLLSTPFSSPFRTAPHPAAIPFSVLSCSTMPCFPAKKRRFLQIHAVPSSVSRPYTAGLRTPFPLSSGFHSLVNHEEKRNNRRCTKQTEAHSPAAA